MSANNVTSQLARELRTAGSDGPKVKLFENTGLKTSVTLDNKNALDPLHCVTTHYTM